MPIVIAPQNQPLTIIKIAADDKTKKHLESLGITANGDVTVLNSRQQSVSQNFRQALTALRRKHTRIPIR